MLDGKDADWLLDLWFAGYAKFDGLHGALGGLPTLLVEQRLERELAEGDRARVEAAIWLLFHARLLTYRNEIYRRLTMWPDPYIADLARRVVVLEERSARVQATRAVRTASRRQG